MSITKQTTTAHVAGAIMYAHFGRPADEKRSRAAAWRSDFNSPHHAIQTIESLVAGTGRKNEALLIIQSFSKDELDPNDKATPGIVADAGYMLAKKVAPNSPCDVVVHLDSEGGNPHAHITIANADLVTGKAARESGLHHPILMGANDEVMRDMGLQVLEPSSLAHDVHRARSNKSAAGLSVDELDRSTWREFLADRVDEALLDPRSIDFASLQQVAAELGVSIRKKSSAKSEAAGRDPTLTYALVDDSGQPRRFGRSKAACTARKLGADYSWSGVNKTLEELQMEGKKSNVKSSEQSEGERAIEQLAPIERPTRVGRIGQSCERVDESHERSEPSDRGSNGNDELTQLAARLDEERRKRDAQDAERAARSAENNRRNRQRQADREARRRQYSARFGSTSVCDDEIDHRLHRDDDYDFGF